MRVYVVINADATQDFSIYVHEVYVFLKKEDAETKINEFDGSFDVNEIFECEIDEGIQ